MKLTGNLNTSLSGLTEGIFWNFKKKTIATELLDFYGIDPALIPEIVPTFGLQGQITRAAAEELALPSGLPVCYRAGDQPNNAFSLNVLDPGDAAANAGTSGVVFGVSGSLVYDPKSRVNLFAHVNHSADQPRLGVLLCINGVGILYSWLKKYMAGEDASYQAMDKASAEIQTGSNGLMILPFGNGAERMLENQNIGCRMIGLDFNRHNDSHIYRAAQEGIAFSFRYGIDIMKGIGVKTKVIRAGTANMFLSPVFTRTLADVTGSEIELYDTDGALGAARGAAVGSDIFKSFPEAFEYLTLKKRIEPDPSNADIYEDIYKRWKEILDNSLSTL
jgi:xylulokinase